MSQHRLVLMKMAHEHTAGPGKPQFRVSLVRIKPLSKLYQRTFLRFKLMTRNLSYDKRKDIAVKDVSISFLFQHKLVVNQHTVSVM